jgi:excisionase family DNA binding protein
VSGPSPPTHIGPELDALLDAVARRIVALQAALQSEPATGQEAAHCWLGIEQAARYLDWPRQRLYKLTAAAAIPHYKHEGRLLFRRDQLDAWLEPFYAGPERAEK